MVILIQGAMPEEIDFLIQIFNANDNKKINGYNFYISSYNNKIVISQTGCGIINTCISTSIAINEFKPDLVITNLVFHK